MRVLIAFDGSPSAHVAVELARTLAWPTGSLIRIAQVLPRTAFADVPNTGRPGEEAESGLERAAGRVRREGLTVERDFVRSDAPAEALVDEARRLNADLLIVGHRGHGAIATVFLGSVARDVTENAPCPVLVARRAGCHRILLAEDGSDSAFTARRTLATWPIFLGRAVKVVSVAQVFQPLPAGVNVAVRAEARVAQHDDEAVARVAHGRLASVAAEDLVIAGLHASADTRIGDPAEEIVAAAREMDADLIVLGTRGRGTVARVLLGSVARAVLLSAPCSVLVVRGT